MGAGRPPREPSRRPPAARLPRAGGGAGGAGVARAARRVARLVARHAARLGGRAAPVAARDPVTPVLVVDATVVLAACAAEDGFAHFADPDLVAPPLMWSEARAVLHELARRGDLPAAQARRMRRAVDRAPVAEQAHPSLGETSWDI